MSARVMRSQFDIATPPQRSTIATALAEDETNDHPARMNVRVFD
jgi:hypothetical protein